MKKTTLIILGCLWLGLGCGTIKSWIGLDKKPQEELKLPPSEEGVPVDENGNPVFTDEHLTAEEEPRNVWGIIFLAGFVVSAAFVVRYIVKNKSK